MKQVCNWKEKAQSKDIIACPICGQNGFAERINIDEPQKLLTRVVHIASLDMEDITAQLEILEACQIVSEQRQSEIMEVVKAKREINKLRMQ